MIIKKMFWLIWKNSIYLIKSDNFKGKLLTNIIHILYKYYSFCVKFYKF